MKKGVLILIIFILSVGFVSAQLADSPWPTFHGNSQRTGLSPYDTSYVDGTIKWTFEAENGFEASPIIGPDGTVYIGSHDGYLYAVNPDGTLKWKFKIGTPMEKEFGGHVSYTSTLSTPSITKDGVLYITSRDQYLYAISDEGKEIWRFSLGISFDHWASPAVAEDGTVYIVSSKPRAGLIAVSPEGKEKWYYKVDANTFNSPSIGKDGTIYAGLGGTYNNNLIIAFNKDGSVKWKIQTELFPESSPAIGKDGTIYFGTLSETGKDGGLLAVSSDGKIKWHFSNPKIREVMSTPAIGKDGTIYVGMYEGIFFAVNPDGTEKWRMEFEKTLGSSPAISNEGTIYFGYSSAETDIDSFYALNPDGSIKWSALRGSNIVSSPAIAEDGTIYIGSWDRKLYALGNVEDEVEEVIEEEQHSEKKPDIAECVKNDTKECEEFCTANREECPDYWMKKEKRDYSDEESTNDEIVVEDFTASEGTHEDNRNFFEKIIDWFRALFGNEEARGRNTFSEEDISAKEGYKPKRDLTKKTETEICITNGDDSLIQPLLSMPFAKEDYFAKNWGMIPYCTDPWDSGNIHYAIDYELKPTAKVYAATDGKVTALSYNDEEGAGEIMHVQGDSFVLDYSGLLNIKLKVGESMKRGDYIADVYETPHGEYHVHLGLFVNRKTVCPWNYMDEGFRENTLEFFSQAHYPRQDEFPCLCNC